MSGLLLPGLEELELGEGRGEGARRAPRPFRVLSLASSESVRGRARGPGLTPLGVVAHRGGPSKRESQGGQPSPGPPSSPAARRVRMSVTASMSSAGSIAARKSGGQWGDSHLQPPPQGVPGRAPRPRCVLRLQRAPWLGWSPWLGHAPRLGHAPGLGCAREPGRAPEPGHAPELECAPELGQLGCALQPGWPGQPGCALWPGQLGCALRPVLL